MQPSFHLMIYTNIKRPEYKHKNNFIKMNNQDKEILFQL
jgi:hypothetical protein